MKIQVLGTGCPKCNQLYQNAQQAVTESGIDATVEKVTDLNDIMTFGVMVTPALAIDGQVKTTKNLPPDIAAAQQARIKQIETELMRQLKDFDPSDDEKHAALEDKHKHCNHKH